MRIVDIPLRFAHCQLVMADVPTLVDAGGAGDTNSVLAVLAREGLTVSQLGRIILTHGDGDHVDGAAELRRLARGRLATDDSRSRGARLRVGPSCRRRSDRCSPALVGICS